MLRAARGRGAATHHKQSTGERTEGASRGEPGERARRQPCELGLGRAILDSRPIHASGAGGVASVGRQKPAVPLNCTPTTDQLLVRFVGHPRLARNAPWIGEWAVRLHAWLDRSKQLSLPTRLFVLFGTAFGLNSIAAYVIHQITASMTVWEALLLPYEATRGTIGEGWASFLPVGLYIAFIWLCCEYLRRKRWIIKI